MWYNKRVQVIKDAFLILRIPKILKDKIIKRANGKKLSAFVRDILEKAIK